MISHFQDGGRDVISHNRVLPAGEYVEIICHGLCSSVASSFVHINFPLTNVIYTEPSSQFNVLCVLIFMFNLLIECHVHRTGFSTHGTRGVQSV